MTRTLTLTPAEWEVLQRYGTAWIVREGDCPHKVLPCGGDDCCCPHFAPAELVTAAAPCETCGGERELYEDSMLVIGVPGGRYPVAPCSACRITLVGNPVFLRPSAFGTSTPLVEENASVTLGYAYTDSEVLPILAPPTWAPVLAAQLAHYGDPAALVGRYALKVRLA